MLKAKLLKEGLVPFDKRKDEYERLVEKEMKGERLTDEQYQTLHGDLERWAANLAQKAINIDGQLAIRKFGFQLNGDPLEETHDQFEYWKRSAGFFKLNVHKKLTEVKHLIALRSKQDLQDENSNLLDSMAKDIKHIRLLLEQRLPAPEVEKRLERATV